MFNLKENPKNIEVLNWKQMFLEAKSQFKIIAMLELLLTDAKYKDEYSQFK